MPVTFNVVSHPARAFPPSALIEVDPQRVLLGACEPEAAKCKEIIKSSLEGEDLDHLVPQTNGFVHTVMEAHADHRDLRIRPDDVWLAILIQFNFYVTAHAKELRSHFVGRPWKKTLTLDVSPDADRYTHDYAQISRLFADEIHENVVDKTLAGWILPNFTTTTEKDTVIFSVTMMSTLKEYFDYSLDDTCGIPSVTLDGERSDWEAIYRRIDRLHDFGLEPSVWAEMLRPILRRFIAAFDGEPDVPFWICVAHRSQDNCGKDDLSGWLTAFCVWTPDGEWVLRVLPEGPIPRPEGIDSISTQTAWSRFGRTLFPRKLDERRLVSERKNWADYRKKVRECFTLDGVPYPIMQFLDIPPGFCGVDVELVEHGKKLDCRMVAGHVAYSISAKEPGGALTTVSPSPQWFFIEKKAP